MHFRFVCFRNFNVGRIKNAEKYFLRVKEISQGFGVRSPNKKRKKITVTEMQENRKHRK